jgi:hypothetical protein
MQHEGYCFRCKTRRPIADAVEEEMKDGRRAVKGNCPDCGVVVFKIIGGKLGPHDESHEEGECREEEPSELPEGPGSAGLAASPDTGRQRDGQ